MSIPIIGKCWGCGSDLTTADFGRETLCLSCGKATRVCKNCRWFDPARSLQCQEPMAEKVQDKARANYCEFFEATRDARDAGAAVAVDVRKTAEDLFK